MSRIQHFCFTLLLVALLAITIVTATSGNPAPIPVSVDERKFQDLLNSVEPSALHDILHEHFKDKYQHGVYQEDKTAIKAVHKQNAEVARSLIELARRQAGPGTNGTVTTSETTTISPISGISVTPTPTQTPSPPIDSASETPTTPTPTPSPTPTLTPTPTTLSTSTEGSSSLSEDSFGTPSSTPSSTRSSGPSPTSSNTSSSSSSTSLNISTSSSKLLTSTLISQGSIRSSTREGSITQSVVYTTTLADGAPSTVTQITVVPADQVASQGNGGSGSSTSTADASLQTNGASTTSSHLGVSGCVGILGLVVAWAL